MRLHGILYCYKLDGRKVLWQRIISKFNEPIFYAIAISVDIRGLFCSTLQLKTEKYYGIVKLTNFISPVTYSYYIPNNLALDAKVCFFSHFLRLCSKWNRFPIIYLGLCIFYWPLPFPDYLLFNANYTRKAETAR